MDVAGLRKIHMGRNVERIREMKGIKQEALATALGISQQAVSKIEQSEVIDDERLERIANALGTSAEGIKNFSDELAINIISSTLHHSSFANHNHNPVFNFNPIEKLMEAMEANKALYERLLADKEKALQEKEHLIQTLLSKH